jgi:tRNA modification GTPase
MAVYAAVTTGQGTGAISTIQIFGDSVEAMIKKVFKPIGTKTSKFETGQIHIGTISDGDEVIDQVTTCSEGPDTFTINCHGNPLIVELIMQLLQRNGANLVTAEQLLTKTLSAQERKNTIAIEAKLAQARAKTIEGTKIIMNQIEAGLTKKAKAWIESIDQISLDSIKAEAIQILQKSQAAKLIIYGCTAVLTGPPNSGKSTLLNCLAGRQKAIVTDIKGTTRDWVSARCWIGSLSVELIDTAGLDEKLQDHQDNIEVSAQQKTFEILEETDIVLLVLDASRSIEEFDYQITKKFESKVVITVLNKSDLPAKFDTSQLPETLSSTVQISAKEGAGIESLNKKIIKTIGVADFDLHGPVSFTARQENILRELTNTKSKQQATSIITELLNGQIRV